MDTTPSTHDAKRDYLKPRLRVIELVAEEVLAVGCKMVTPPPGPTASTTCTLNTSCYVPGS